MAEQNANFQGLRVAGFESRRTGDMARLIDRYGGVPSVSPSMREVRLDDDQAVADFANRLLTGQVDVVIILTGVGFRHLLQLVQRRVDRQRFLETLSDVTTIARGPKPDSAMRDVGLTPTLRVPEPHTWRQVLQSIDQHLTIANQTVAIQEYGESNSSLIAGLEARGARVLQVRVYDWDLPEDPGPLEANLRAVAAGERDVLLFTSANQVANVVRLAEACGLYDSLRAQFDRMLVGSVGPTTSEMLRRHHWPVDVEPEHPKLGHLIVAAARECREVLDRKRRVTSTLRAAPSVESARANAWFDSPFMKACRRERTDVTPVWLMRQAGRYMAEYRAVRKQVSFLELCKNPALCSEVMCTAVQKLGVDAAIIFSDLLPILEPMGMDLEFTAGGGPVIHNPVQDAVDVDRVLELESVQALDFVMETVRQTRRDLPPPDPPDRLRGRSVYLGQLRHRRRGPAEITCTPRR
jgi:uroporphyrinogen decarboxylase